MPLPCINPIKKVKRTTVYAIKFVIRPDTSLPLKRQLLRRLVILHASSRDNVHVPPYGNNEETVQSSSFEHTFEAEETSSAQMDDESTHTETNSFASSRAESDMLADPKGTSARSMKKPSPIEKLPYQVRVAIWKRVAEALPRCTIRVSEGKLRLHIGQQGHHRFAVPLTCRRFYHEANLIIFGETRWSFEKLDSFLAFSEHIRPEYLAMLTHINISGETYKHGGERHAVYMLRFDEVAYTIRARMPRVTALEFEYEAGQYFKSAWIKGAAELLVPIRKAVRSNCVAAHGEDRQGMRVVLPYNWLRLQLRPVYNGRRPAKAKYLELVRDQLKKVTAETGMAVGLDREL